MRYNIPDAERPGRALPLTRIKLAGDLQARQSLLELFHTGIGDLCALEVEEGKLRQPVQMRQPQVGDPGTAQVESPEVGQPFQMRQP